MSQPPKLLDQFRNALRLKHHSMDTESRRISIVSKFNSVVIWLMGLQMYTYPTLWHASIPMRARIGNGSIFSRLNIHQLIRVAVFVVVITFMINR